jgi:hypothetical protein
VPVPNVFTPNTQAKSSEVNENFDYITDLFEEAWAEWVPTLSANASMTYSGTSITYAKKLVVGKLVVLMLAVTGTVGGTPSFGLRFTLPETVKNSGATLNNIGSGSTLDGGGAQVVLVNTTTAEVRDYAGNNWSAGTRGYTVVCVYEKA